ncbi:MAG: hypothetical protein SV760_01910, partial [Halobacteria archaeon]|nr:hypothetical protein [Halobacteria archaeon]
NRSIYGYNGGFKIKAVDSQASPDYNDFYVKNGVTYAHLVAFGNIFFQNGVKISLHFDEPYANVANNSCAIG